VVVKNVIMVSRCKLQNGKNMIISMDRAKPKKEKRRRKERGMLVQERK
jgi:hypothetical protein